MTGSIKLSWKWNWSGLLKFKPFSWYVEYSSNTVKIQTHDYDSRAEANAEYERLKKEAGL